jgi:hypothetical protein
VVDDLFYSGSTLYKMTDDPLVWEAVVYPGMPGMGTVESNASGFMGETAGAAIDTDTGDLFVGFATNGFVTWGDLYTFFVQRNGSTTWEDLTPSQVATLGARYYANRGGIVQS